MINALGPVIGCFTRLTTLAWAGMQPLKPPGWLCGSSLRLAQRPGRKASGAGTTERIQGVCCCHMPHIYCTKKSGGKTIVVLMPQSIFDSSYSYCIRWFVDENWGRGTNWINKSKIMTYLGKHFTKYGTTTTTSNRSSLSHKQHCLELTFQMLTFDKEPNWYHSF